MVTINVISFLHQSWREWRRFRKPKVIITCGDLTAYYREDLRGYHWRLWQTGTSKLRESMGLTGESVYMGYIGKDGVNLMRPDLIPRVKAAEIHELFEKVCGELQKVK